MDPVEVVAANIRRLRTAADLTQEELSARSGVDLASVGRIERGLRDPGVRTLARLAGGLGCEPADLLRDTPALRAPGS